MHKTTSGGYVGLLTLIISLALMGLLAWRSDLFVIKSTSPSPIDIAPTTIQGQLNAIDSAKAARDQLQNKYDSYAE